MTRPSDRENAKSWVIELKNGEPILSETKWQPGYTPSHCATPREAIARAINKASMDLVTVGTRLHKLQNMYEEEREHDEAMDAALERPNFNGDYEAELAWERGL